MFEAFALNVGGSTFIEANVFSITGDERITYGAKGKKNDQQKETEPYVYIQRCTESVATISLLFHVCSSLVRTVLFI